MQGRLWIRAVCALNIIFILAMIMAVSSDDPGVFSEKLDLRIHLIQIIGVLGVAGTILVFIGGVRSWRDRAAWWWAKVWNVLILLACLSFVWFVIYWNLLNFHLNY